MGPTDRYLRLAPGSPTHDLMAMAREGTRAKLRSANSKQAILENRHVVVPGGRTNHNGRPVSFRIAVQPIPNEVEELLLVCFVDEPN